MTNGQERLQCVLADRMSHLPGRTEQDSEFITEFQSSMQLHTHGLCSGSSHLIFSDCGWAQVTATTERETVDNGGLLYASLGLRDAIPFEVLLAMLWCYLSILTEELPPPQLPTLTFDPASQRPALSSRRAKLPLCREVCSATVSPNKRILDQGTALSKHIF